jgi:DNA-binding GntR family transcriptional regulator
MQVEGDARAKPKARWAEVYANLRSAIIAHRIQPGRKLSEDELASIYGVSRTIVRSALQALAHDRLVNLEPNRGAFVAQPTAEEARQVFDARALIEPHLAALAADRAVAGDIAALRHQVEEESRVSSPGMESEALLQSARFHLAIADIAGQPILTDYVRDLVSRSSLIIALYWKRRDTTCEGHAHDALIEAIGRHDREAAAAIMKSHIVDLLSGLDLKRGGASEPSLAQLLGTLEPKKAQG